MLFMVPLFSALSTAILSDWLGNRRCPHRRPHYDILRREDLEPLIDETEERFLELIDPSKLPYADHAVAMYFAAIDPESPFTVRAKILFALAYFLSPIDAVPDVAGPWGYSDDALVIYEAYDEVRDHIQDRHYRRAGHWLRGWLAD